MQVFNKIKTQILGDVDTFDASKGKLEDDFVEVFHPATAGVERKSHFEIVKVYENGGKDVVEVVDCEGVEACDAYTEQIPIKVYIPYTDEELQKREKEKLDEDTRTKNLTDNLEFLKTISVEEFKKIFK